MIDEILNVNLLAQGPPSPKFIEVSLASLVQETLELFEPLKQALHPIQIVIPDSLLARADQQQIKQILRNLISNAFKYTPPGTDIVIIAKFMEPLEQLPLFICVCVKDSGPGIPLKETAQPQTPHSLTSSSAFD